MKTDKNHTTILTGGVTYKDGGSISYTDKDGNKYWLCNKFGDKNLKYKNKLFISNINDFPEKAVLATGRFLLKDSNKIIIQN